MTAPDLDVRADALWAALLAADVRLAQHNLPPLNDHQRAEATAQVAQSGAARIIVAGRWLRIDVD